jgi:hypothetical protein
MLLNSWYKIYEGHEVKIKFLNFVPFVCFVSLVLQPEFTDELLVIVDDIAQAIIEIAEGSIIN